MKTIYYAHVIDSTKKACDIVKEYTHSRITSYVGQSFKNETGRVCFLHPDRTFIHWDWTEKDMRACYSDCEYICIDGIIGIL